MLKRSITYLLAFFVCTVSVAQNLVANPGFEIYNNCPPDRSAIAYSPTYTYFPTATSWVSAVGNTTPDYYNTCATNPHVQLPYNSYNDFQQPHGGVACAGIAVQSGFPKTPELSDYREYLETRLLQPLVAGKQYYLSFFVNETFHKPESTTEIVIDMIGARFTGLQISDSFPQGETKFFVEGPPDIYNPRNTFLEDTALWSKVSGVYTAKGGEQWLTIGYFKDSLPINFKVLYSPVDDPDSIHSTCYMYVDDVCVIEIQPPGRDTLYVDSFPLEISASAQNGEHQWSTGDSTAAIIVQEPGTYWVRSTDDCYYRTDTIVVICNMDDATSTSVMPVSSFPVEISSTLPEGIHLWNTGVTSPTIIITEAGTYWVESNYQCMHRIDTFYVYCKEDTVRSHEVVYAGSFPLTLGDIINGDSILWSNGSRDTAIMVTAIGHYGMVIWRGCKRYIHTIDVVERSPDECLWLPSAFTPDGDGLNDQFGPVNVCRIDLPYYNLSIYNRFGECVFTTDDITHKWDGQYRGQKADVGAYYYMMRYTTPSNADDVVLRKGDVTLIR